MNHLKSNFLILSILIAFSGISQNVTKGSLIITPYVGAPNFGVVFGKLVKNEIDKRTKSGYFDIDAGVGPNGVRGEFMITEKLSIGFDYIYNEVNGSGYIDSTVNSLVVEKYNININSKRHRFLIKGNYHFLSNDKIDFYGAAGIGYNFRKIDVQTNFPKIDNKTFNGSIQPVAARIALGFTYYPIKPIGLNFELGAGGPIVSAGISIKLNVSNHQ